MKPLDPRLLRYARPARAYIALTAALGGVTAALVIAQALLLARVLAPVVSGTATIDAVRWPLLWLAVTMLARAAVVWAQERYGQRAGVDVVANLREQVVEHAAMLGPRWLSQGRGPEVATLVTRGLDDLQPYLVRYLPQLLLAATVTPATIAVVLGLDWVSAVIAIGTLPLVPIFMILIGYLTQGTAERRLTTMTRLGSQVLDVMAGLPTLRAFGRARGPEKQIQRLGDDYRKTTMGTLRIAFLSGMVLELLTTLSVAVIAVSIGLRLVHGGMSLEVGLAVLVLAPEIYQPLRQVGAHFHASTDGLAAAKQAFAVLETPLPQQGNVPCPVMAGGAVVFADLSVIAPGRDRVAPAHLSARVEPGTITALIGPNGSGKSTAVDTILGLVPADAGSVLLEAADGERVRVSDVDLPSWWSQVAWLPQRPHLTPGTILSNVLGPLDGNDPVTAPGGERQQPTPAILAAAALTGLDTVVASRADGWQTVVGDGGDGLSVGQRQRVALTAALLGSQPFVVLDEPTAHLDADAAHAVHRTLTALRELGRTVLVVTHRPDLAAEADTVIRVASAQAGATDEDLAIAAEAQA